MVLTFVCGFHFWLKGELTKSSLVRGFEENSYLPVVGRGKERSTVSKALDLGCFILFA